MNPVPTSFTPQAVGSTVVERQMLNSLARFWEGDLTPDDLPRAERSLRALLTGRTLVVSRFFGLSNISSGEASQGSPDFRMPFDEPALDYEFLLPDQPQPVTPLAGNEASFLEKFVSRSLQQAVSSMLPKWVSKEGEALAFFDAWYKGEPVHVCEARAAKMADWEVFTDPYDSKLFDYHLDQLEHAKYLVGCSRAGAVVYGDSPLASICAEHIFAKWPEELFRTLDEDFRSAARQIRGPDVAFSIPPLIALILSRARLRHHIPETIRDLREEYSEARERLWGVIQNMWAADTFREQVKLLRLLESAGQSMFAAAYPEKLDVLSVGLSVAPMTPSAVASAGKVLLEYNKPRARVAAVSFAKKLTNDLRQRVANCRVVLKRHLSHEEARNFGLE